MGRSANGADAFAGEDDELPEHPATVAEFFLDSFEVTVGRFRRFVEQFDGTPPSEGAAAHPLIEDSGWEASWDSNLPTSTGALASHAACNPSLRTWTDTPGSRETHPVNCVTWYTAFAFCAWDGGRLPTEAEWEFAAAGGEENRLYPWGQQPPDMTRSGFDCGWGGTSGQCTLSDLGAVGSTPAGEARWGHQDLAGSLWEYVLDRHSDAWYAGPGNPCDNCANLAMGMARAIRGGSFQHPSSSLRAANRTFKEPDIPGITIGFRCARNAE
jgi:formylglycine-generating enzyme required for sulfatase activity